MRKGDFPGFMAESVPQHVICRERPVSLESRKDTEPDRGGKLARLP